MVQKRVCILTLGVGSGHLRASEAVQRALYDSVDPVESKVIDALDSARPVVPLAVCGSVLVDVAQRPLALAGFF